jgi:hypothetical protein
VQCEVYLVEGENAATVLRCVAEKWRFLCLGLGYQSGLAVRGRREERGGRPPLHYYSTTCTPQQRFAYGFGLFDGVEVGNSGGGDNNDDDDATVLQSIMVAGNTMV